MNSEKKRTAVIVAWNGGESLDQCIASLRTETGLDILVVDNGSGPLERARLAREYAGNPDVRLLQLEENRGFAEGANIGIREVLRGGASEVLLATQDVAVEPGAVEALAAALKAAPEAGIAGPLVFDSERGGTVLSRGERFALPFICLPRTWLRPRRPRSQAYDVSGVMGCLMLLTGACLESTGGFDARFFAYYEEVDLCIRARRAGFRVLCVPAAVAHHRGMRGFRSGFTPLSAELKARNLVLLMRKLGRPRDWLPFLPTYAALLLSSGLLYAMRGRLDIAAALFRGAREGWGSADTFRIHPTTGPVD